MRNAHAPFWSLWPSVVSTLDNMGAPNWPGLYKWAARYSDGTDPSSFDRLSVEDKRWCVWRVSSACADLVRRAVCALAYNNGCVTVLPSSDL